jgi:hypothetical protein
MERMAEKEEGEHEVSPEVAAARAEQEPLVEEDLGEETEEDDDAVEDDAEGEEGDEDAQDAGTPSDDGKTS